ncbi:MAG: caspase family protein, partial [Gammaproteobacteria bacterium]|nr:caspase family protein [Gammaproteobacteria bacterium]
MSRMSLAALLLLLPLLAAAEPRVALVIGNSAYASGPLRNPANDAGLMGETLKRVGFEVIERRDADQITMKRAIQDFGSRLEAAGPKAVGLFYYAGHGVQLEGRNYLIPTTAKIEREGDVEIEAVSADWVIAQMRFARNALNIVILDACRNNPFVRSLRSADRGLAMMYAPTGILIAYSAAPGSVAEDGEGRNSPYTTALSRAMLEVHEPLLEVFAEVREDVLAATGQRQVPGEYDEVVGGRHFYFTAPEKAATASAPPASAPTPARTSAATTAATPAATLPAAPAAPRSEEPGLLSSGIKWVAGLFSSASVPVGPGNATATHGGSAELSPIPPAAPAKASSGAGSGTVTGSSEPLIAGARILELFGMLGVTAAGMDASHSYPESAVRRVLESSPRRVRLGSTAEQIRSAIALCRRYASSCDYNDERLRSATLAPFQLDEFPVSVRSFRHFAQSAGYRTHAEQVGYGYALKPNGSYEEVSGGSWRNALRKRAVDEDSAVVGVTFPDALAYCRANRARLPTEDEWEYVARGPAGHIYPWGDDPAPVARSMSIAPHVSDGPDEGIGGHYRGLSGSVWQWVDTTLDPRGGSGGAGECCKVLKGGSWMEPNPANK